MSMISLEFQVTYTMDVMIYISHYLRKVLEN